MRIFSLFASARLTHASSLIADTDARPAAGRTLTSFSGRESRRSYLLPLGHRDALPRPAGRGPSRATTQTNPHLRDIQESAR
jgi:hypothetical protein